MRKFSYLNALFRLADRCTNSRGNFLRKDESKKVINRVNDFIYKKGDTTAALIFLLGVLGLLYVDRDINDQLQTAALQASAMLNGVGLGLSIFKIKEDNIHKILTAGYMISNAGYAVGAYFMRKHHYLCPMLYGGALAFGNGIALFNKLFLTHDRLSRKYEQVAFECLSKEAQIGIMAKKNKVNIISFATRLVAYVPLGMRGSLYAIIAGGFGTALIAIHHRQHLLEKNPSRPEQRSMISSDFKNEIK